MKSCLISVILILLSTQTLLAGDALDEVNAARAARGLRPFIRDEGLTIAAIRASEHRAAYRIAGHVGGGMGDFAFLPPGSHASAAGCGALEPWWGWGTCCTYDNYERAGAAVTVVAGIRFMHLFVAGGSGSSQRETTVTRTRTFLRRR